ncbi:MmgE/PrpD family protein [Streptomyces olivaceus]|uniref:MmgE/PrpD family protein n=1 Tax=Streptomyces olivaceus TaxID=47716 RepID=UPI004057324B
MRGAPGLPRVTRQGTHLMQGESPVGAAEDASRHLAGVVAGMTFDDLSPEAVTAAKRGILDTIGVSLAATGASPDYLDPVRRFLSAVAAPGSVPAPTLGTRMTALDAILWMGSLAHTLDYDDVAGYSHPSGPVVSAALPIAHAEGAIDGRRLITAVALGQDMVIRLAQAVRRPVSHYGWLPSIPGVLGAAVTTAKLVDLDAEQTRNAMGLALHQTSGTMQAVARPGSAYRAIREGINARAGALSALLAREGMPGDDESIEGQYGYFQQFFEGDYDPDFLRGEALLGPITSFKPWPCAGHPQLFLTALRGLLGSVDIENITKIRITGCSDLLPHQCLPVDARAAPSTSIDAKISIPFLIGKLLCHGTLSMQDFSPEGLDDAPAIALARRVEHTLDPSLKRGANGYGVGIVEVEHTGGRTVRAETEFPLGHPHNPLNWDDIVDKFHRCVEEGASMLSAKTVGSIVSAVADLDTVPDSSVLLELPYEGGQRADGDWGRASPTG